MSADEALACVITNGGPLIVLPHEIVGLWRGTLPPLGVDESHPIVCVYDRACGEPA